MLTNLIPFASLNRMLVANALRKNLHNGEGGYWPIFEIALLAKHCIFEIALPNEVEGLMALVGGTNYQRCCRPVCNDDGVSSPQSVLRQSETAIFCYKQSPVLQH